MSEPRTETSGGSWSVTIDPPVLLPSRTAQVVVRHTPDRDRTARSVAAVLNGVETYRYDRSESAPGANGPTTRRVTHTDRHELSRTELTLAGPGSFRKGEEVEWSFELAVPDLGPATFEGSELRCDWTLEVKLDVPRAFDARISLPVHVAQPMALLRAGVLDLGQYALFSDAPANLDAHPAQIAFDPVPLCLGAPFSGRLSLETREPVDVQEVRLELRVHAQVTVPGGRSEEITIGIGQLATDAGRFGGEFARHAFTGRTEPLWLPSVDLPHGTARARFHVILAQAWRRDIHYVRDVALSTTSDL
ncbi:MAG TPA: arrestin C-terminal domain-containing protein [Candidatus Limnocylindria bacterium]|nr:arrestin C-terminal domain-containing protein [Candidatus Limnocylindria bacterium]